MYENAIKSCSSCNKFEKEINDLKKNLAQFTFGKNNLDIILGKQRCVFDKLELGYNPKGQQKFYKNFFVSSKMTISPFLTCFYYGKKCHSVSTCYTRKNRNTIGKMIWVPRGTLPKSNIQGPKEIWVPKSKL